MRVQNFQEQMIKPTVEEPFPYASQLFCILSPEQREKLGPSDMLKYNKTRMYIFEQLLRRVAKGDIVVEIQTNPDRPVEGSPEVEGVDRRDILIIRAKNERTAYVLRDAVSNYIQGLTTDIVFPET